MDMKLISLIDVIATSPLIYKPQYTDVCGEIDMSEKTLQWAKFRYHFCHNNTTQGKHKHLQCRHSYKDRVGEVRAKETTEAP